MSLARDGEPHVTMTQWIRQLQGKRRLAYLAKEYFIANIVQIVIFISESDNFH